MRLLRKHRGLPWLRDQGRNPRIQYPLPTPSTPHAGESQPECLRDKFAVQCEILTQAPITQPWSSPPVTSSQCPAPPPPPRIHIHVPILFSPWPSAPSTVYSYTPLPLLAFLVSPLLTHCLQAPPTHPLPRVALHRP